MQGKSQSTFKSNIESYFSNVKNLGCNTVIVQVRPFGDAIYESSYFPTSYYITGSGQGGSLPFDALDVMITAARKYGLQIHAWINPYRVKAAGSKFDLSSDNQAYIWMNDPSTSHYVMEYSGGYYYNPAVPEVRQLVVNGVKELVQNYDLDGIHFDDYFYPGTDESLDAASYKEYTSSGGTLSLAAWRRENVNTLIRETYAAVKAIDSSCMFGVSPAGNISNNYNLLYADVAKWCSNTNYIDYICPQIYWGFEHSTAAFDKVLDQWANIVTSSSVTLYVGLAPYKCGTVDSSNREWIENTDILMRQVLYAREKSQYGGFVLYRYDSVFRPGSDVASIVASERKNLQSILN